MILRRLLKLLEKEKTDRYTRCLLVPAPKSSWNLELYPSLLLFGFLMHLSTLFMCNKMQNSRRGQSRPWLLPFTHLSSYMKSLHCFIALNGIENCKHESQSIKCEKPWEKNAFIHICWQHFSWDWWCRNYLESVYTSSKITQLQHCSWPKLPSIYCQHQLSASVIYIPQTEMNLQFFSLISKSSFPILEIR